MKYILYLYGGIGCDYTIACGETIENIEVNNREELDKAIKDKIEEYGRDRIESAAFYKISESGVVDIKELFAQDDADEKTRAQDKKENEERAKLAELQKKYPAPPEK